MNNNFSVIFCTCPDLEISEKIANAILQNKLCACINIIKGVISKYWWQGKIQNDSEIMLIIKSDSSHFKKIESLIISLHPYETPEIILLPITDGSNKYLKWIKNTLES